MSHLPAVHAIYQHSLTQVVSSGTRTKMLFNGLGPRTQQAEIPGLYNTTTQKLMPQQQGEIYLLRVEFTAQAAVVPLVQPTVTMEWDFGATQDGTSIFAQDVRTYELSVNPLPILYNTSAFRRSDVHCERREFLRAAPVIQRDDQQRDSCGYQDTVNA